MNYYYFNKFGEKKRKTFPHLTQKKILSLPIPKEKANNKLNPLVDRMLDLNKRLLEEKTTNKKTLLNKQIEDTDDQINNVVYSLYKLTNKEIKIIEDSFKES